MVGALLIFLAHGLVLTAFSLSKVSYVAPAREVGIVNGVLLGVFLLKELFGGGRLLGSCHIILGTVLIAISPIGCCKNALLLPRVSGGPLQKELQG